MGKILPSPIEDEVQRSYLDYAMSVIVSRALPDVRDGLKPVHRRILYAMYKLGLVHNHAFRKCATVVGEVLGKYHPHGDNAVYDSLVRMVQTFSLRYPLINGQGNFGSIDGDHAAAYRYTEAKLTQIAELMLEDIEKETVDFKSNFDNRLQEPVVLPSVFPNLLVNGTSGIAVGMATNLPPHNLGEVVDALCAIIDDPSIESLSKYIKGPDFPTGALIVGESGIESAYTTGRGKITLKAVATIEENHRTSIIITELPYQVNKAELISHIAELVREKRIEGISNLRDESDREGMRVVLELKNNAPAQIILNKLFKHTSMQITYGIIMLALQNDIPKLLTLREMLDAFLEHRHDVVKKRAEFDLKENEKRAHILEGLQVAVKNIDDVVKIIRNSKTTEDAKKSLIAKFSLTDVQVGAILDMRLARLVGLECEKLEAEYAEVVKTIKKLKHLLSSRKNIMEVIKEELLKLKEKFGDKRRTKIIKQEGKDFDIEDLIPNEPVIVTLTAKGHIKRSKPAAYRKQLRGGKGLIAATLVEEDKIIRAFEAETHAELMFLTNLGRCYKAKVYELPEFERAARGRAIVNILPLREGEYIKAALPLEDVKFNEDALTIVTAKGLVKKSTMSSYEDVRKSGIIAITLREGDEIAFADIVKPKDWIIIVTQKGKAIRFEQSKVRMCGRTAQGVRGIKIRGEDRVITVKTIDDENACLMFMTVTGYGKRVIIRNFRLTNRGGVGVIASKEPLASCELVEQEDEILVTTSNGKTLRTLVKSIRKMGRSARGVRIIRLDTEDQIADIQVVSTGIEQKEEHETDAQKPEKSEPVKEETVEEEQVEELEEEEKGQKKTLKGQKKIAEAEKKTTKEGETKQAFKEKPAEKQKLVKEEKTKARETTKQPPKGKSEKSKIEKPKIETKQSKIQQPQQKGKAKPYQLTISVPTKPKKEKAPERKTTKPAPKKESPKPKAAQPVKKAKPEKKQAKKTKK